MKAPFGLLGASALPRPPEDKSVTCTKINKKSHSRNNSPVCKTLVKKPVMLSCRLLCVIILLIGLPPGYHAAPSGGAAGPSCDLVVGDATARVAAAAQVLEALVETRPGGRNVYTAALMVRRVLRRYKGPGRLKKENVITLTLQRAPIETCIAVASLNVGERYFVFLNAPERRGVAPKAVAAPLPYSKRTRRVIRQHTCSKCAARKQKPLQAMSRLPQSDSAVRGQSVNFTCSFEGMPLPKIQWYKDDVPIVLDGRTIMSNDESGAINTTTMNIITRRVRSRRRIRSRRRRRRRSHIGTQSNFPDEGPLLTGERILQGSTRRRHQNRMHPLGHQRPLMQDVNSLDSESHTYSSLDVTPSRNVPHNPLHDGPLSSQQRIPLVENTSEVVRHSRSRSRQFPRGPSNTNHQRRPGRHYLRGSGRRRNGAANSVTYRNPLQTSTTTTEEPAKTSPVNTRRRKKQRKRKNKNRSRTGSGTRRIVSSLSIGKVDDNHSGVYKCVATSKNRSVEQMVELSVIPPLDTGIVYPCTLQAYCLNGGTCMFFKFVGELVCHCVEGFKGQRCQHKEVYRSYSY